MKNVFFLIDWKSPDRFNISKYLEKFHPSVTTHAMTNQNNKDYEKKYRYPVLIFKYFQVSYKGLSQAKKEDTIVSWNFTMGFCCSVLRFLMMKKTRIVCLNIIAHESKGLSGFVRKKLFSFFLNQPDIYITVNSSDLFAQYNKEFNLSFEKMFVLEDPVFDFYERRPFADRQSYMFCGGVARRDWETLFKACELLPDYRFVGVAQKQNFPAHLNVPANMNMYYDISLEAFNDYLKDSTIQLLPLNSKRPAGLIGIITGALLGIPIITTRTASIENYITDKKSGMLIDMGDYQALAEAIKELFHDPALRKAQVDALTDFIEDNYNEQAYARKLNHILDKISSPDLQLQKTTPLNVPLLTASRG
jgi:glycosyltransferase involved in cell wall biosynthesis